MAPTSQEMAIDAANVRVLQECDNAVIAAAIGPAQGQRATVVRLDGSFAPLECLTRVESGLEPFDALVQAAASQLAAQRVEAHPQSRMGAP